ncbi:hypothetical protein [Bauldia sp.]|uniref:hypothetical protein n=1 Tax=Bauldia sp. TaxID=2575872 RepID=UPI003BAD4C95
MLDLTTVTFTNFSDVVTFTDTLSFPPDLSPAVGIVNDDLVKALRGGDLIEARLTATVGTTLNVTITGLANNTIDSTIATGRGADRIFGHLDVSGGDLGERALFGIDNTDGSIKTGKGSDLVKGSVTAADDGSGVIEATGFAGGTVKTKGGKDEVKGEASAIGGPGSEANAYGIAGADIDTGDGDDLIRGKAIAHSEIDPFAAGLFVTDVNTGAGDDRVIGVVELSGDGFGHGIDGDDDGMETIVRTGAGDDLIEGRAKVTVGAGDDADGDGIDRGLYKTGRGDDTVSGRVVGDIADGSISTGNEGINGADIFTAKGRDMVIGEVMLTIADGGDIGDVRGQGIDNSLVETGDHDDTVIGRVVSLGGDEDELISNWGLSTIDIFTGSGNDKVLGEVEVRGGTNSTVGSNWGITTADIFTGSGNDKVLGKVEVRGGMDSDLGGNRGITSADIFTEDGNDKVIGKVLVEGGDGSDLGFFRGIDSANISTGEGSDTVKGKVSLSVTGTPTDAHGTGLRGLGRTIDTGDKADKVIGIGADIAIGGESYGIAEYTILLGNGADTVKARGETAGVDNVTIKGQGGDDLFDLHSGTGLIDGGKKEDTLVLSGDSGDFTFTDNGGTAGNITDGVTDLDVEKIENFRFDNGLFTFDELFVA